MDMILEAFNNAGLKFVEFASPMLIQSSLLILILLAGDFLLRKKVRAVFRYWIWMLVLIKLMLPVSLYSPLSLGSWFGEKIEYVSVTQQGDTGQKVFKSEKRNVFTHETRNFRQIEPQVENSPTLPAAAETELISNPIVENPAVPISDRFPEAEPGWKNPAIKKREQGLCVRTRFVKFYFSPALIASFSVKT